MIESAGAPRILATVVVFVAMLVLVIKRPRGLHEAVWTLALLVLAALVEKSGFFEWAAIHAARLARGDGRARSSRC